MGAFPLQEEMHNGRALRVSKKIRLVSKSAILGYRFPEASAPAGLAPQPHVIGGSVDPGPHYLGADKPFCSPIAIRRNLWPVLNAAIRAANLIVFGSRSPITMRRSCSRQRFGASFRRAILATPTFVDVSSMLRC